MTEKTRKRNGTEVTTGTVTEALHTTGNTKLDLAIWSLRLQRPSLSFEEAWRLITKWDEIGREAKRRTRTNGGEPMFNVGGGRKSTHGHSGASEGS